MPGPLCSSFKTNLSAVARLAASRRQPFRQQTRAVGTCPLDATRVISSRKCQRVISDIGVGVIAVGYGENTVRCADGNLRNVLTADVG